MYATGILQFCEFPIDRSHTVDTIADLLVHKHRPLSLFLPNRKAHNFSKVIPAHCF